VPARAAGAWRYRKGTGLGIIGGGFEPPWRHRSGLREVIAFAIDRLDDQRRSSQLLTQPEYDNLQQIAELCRAILWRRVKRLFKQRWFDRAPVTRPQRKQQFPFLASQAALFAVDNHAAPFDVEPGVAGTTIGDTLDFFDFVLIAFVLAFIVKDWDLTYGQSAAILSSSGITHPWAP
jgi:hypothetical protein